MTNQNRSIQKISVEQDLVTARHFVRSLTMEMGFNLIDQTRIITAVSELTRNALIHGGGGVLMVEKLTSPRKGMRITIKDDGPGIGDIGKAMTDGYSTKKGLGNGLGGSKRLLDEFKISSKLGKGTMVVAVKWMW